MAVDAPESDLPRYDATPVEAVRRFWVRYAVFTGRASRSEYWWSVFANVVIAVVLTLLVVGLLVVGALLRNAGTGAGIVANALGGVLGLVLVLFFLGQLVPSYAVAVRRLHDADLSGWFVLLAFIPSVGGLILLILHVLPPNPAGRRFDRDAAGWSTAYAPAIPVAAPPPPIGGAQPAFDAWPPPLEPAPPTSPVPAVPAAEVQDRQDDAVRSAWASLGEVRAVEPPLTAPASWRQCGYLAVAGAVPVLATDGLSRSEGVAALGPGAEVYLPGAVDPEGWPLTAIAAVGRRVAVSGMSLPAELEQYGTLSMTVPAVDAPDGWRRDDGSLGVLIGLPIAGFPEAVATPAGEVRLVSVVPLRPAELQEILDGGTEARRRIAGGLAALPVDQLTAPDRPAR